MLFFGWFLGTMIAQADIPRSRKENPLRKSATVLAIAKARPAVVSISTEVVDNNPFSLLYGQGTQSSDGSGVVISSEGLILTNAHVVEQAVQISISFANGKSYTAKIVGLASDLDLALLRLESGASFPAIDIGYSADLMLGESVIAIGNPFGLDHTVTVGVVSALARSIETEQRVFQDFIQTDASINPGNSGGPLINLSGELIGINTAIRANAEGIGFAIPIDRAINIAQDLLTYGDVQRPWLGVSLVDVQLRGEQQSAPKIHSVFSSSSLFQEGDILLSISDHTLRSAADLNTQLAGMSQSSSWSFRIWRKGKEIKIQAKPVLYNSKEQLSQILKRWGATLQPNTTILASVSTNGGLVQHRIRSGDRIFAVNGQFVETEEEFRVALANAQRQHKKTIVLGIQRGRARGQIELSF